MTLYDILRATKYDQRFSCYLTNNYGQNLPIGFGTRRELLDEEINEELFDFLMCPVSLLTIAKDGVLVVRLTDEHFNERIEDQEAVHCMNAASRSSTDKAEKPIWKVKKSIVHTDYADGSADTRTFQRASWCCPVCDWFVGEQVEVFGRKHNQQKKNFCDRCGQKIDWESVEKEA